LEGGDTVTEFKAGRGTIRTNRAMDVIFYKSCICFCICRLYMPYVVLYDLDPIWFVSCSSSLVLLDWCTRDDSTILFQCYIGWQISDPTIPIHGTNALCCHKMIRSRCSVHARYSRNGPPIHFGQWGKDDMFY
jgi:hypothetical protein